MPGRPHPRRQVLPGVRGEDVAFLLGLRVKMIKDAKFDRTGQYRYVLIRQWGSDTGKFVNFVLLNPATADDKIDDRVTTGCIKFAQNLDYDGLYLTNLFSFRATDPLVMQDATDPVGPDNDAYLLKYAKKAQKVIIAWGNHGGFNNRDSQVLQLLSGIQPLYCFQMTLRDKPKHLLYIRRSTKPKLFPCRPAT
jgi:hypothetical protein